MTGDSSAIEELPNEVLLRILRHLYPLAAFQALSVESHFPEDEAWHDSLLNAYLDMVIVSKTSRLFHALSISLAQSHARLIAEEKNDGLILHAIREKCLASVECSNGAFPVAAGKFSRPRAQVLHSNRH